MGATWKIKAHETAKVCDSSSSGKVKTYIPALMPMIQYGKPKKKRKTVRTKFLCNAKKCTPRIAKKIQTQNYMSVPRSTAAGNLSLKKGSKIDIDVRNNNVGKMIIAGKKK